MLGEALVNTDALSPVWPLLGQDFRTEPDGTVSEYSGQVSRLEVIGRDHATEAVAGDIVKVGGVSAIRVGDTLGATDKNATEGYFARPSLETLIRPCRPPDTVTLHAALMALAEQDPLISTRPAEGGQTSVLLYGDIQKEIIAETLVRDFGVEAEFESSRTVYLECPAGRGSAILSMGRTPFVAGVGLRIEPGPRGAGIEFRRETEYGCLDRRLPRRDRNHRAQHVDPGTARMAGHRLRGDPHPHRVR